MRQVLQNAGRASISVPQRISIGSIMSGLICVAFGFVRLNWRYILNNSREFLQCSPDYQKTTQRNKDDKSNQRQQRYPSDEHIQTNQQR